MLIIITAHATWMSVTVEWICVQRYLTPSIVMAMDPVSVGLTDEDKNCLLRIFQEFVLHSVFIIAIYIVTKL